LVEILANRLRAVVSCDRKGVDRRLDVNERPRILKPSSQSKMPVFAIDSIWI
jgi:hypothetical protein